MNFLRDLLGLLVVACVIMVGLVIAVYFVRRYQLRTQRDLWNRFGLRPDPPEPEVTLLVMVKTLVATVMAGANELTTWVGTYHGFSVSLTHGLSARITGTLSGIDRDLMRARITITHNGPTIDHFTAEAWLLELAAPPTFLMQVVDRMLVESPRRARKTSRHAEEVYTYHHVARHAAFSTGDDELDARLIAFSNRPDDARTLLTQPEVRGQLLALAHVDVEIDTGAVRVHHPATASRDLVKRSRSHREWLDDCERVLGLMVTIARRVTTTYAGQHRSA